MPDWAVLGIGVLLVIMGGITAYVVNNSKKGRTGFLVESSIPSNVGTPDTSSPVNTKPKKLWKPTSDKYLKNSKSTTY